MKKYAEIHGSLGSSSARVAYLDNYRKLGK